MLKRVQEKIPGRGAGTHRHWGSQTAAGKFLLHPEGDGEV
jgi:hypothetical protein